MADEKIPRSKITRPGEALVNNSWHTLNSSETVYVFVHGFFSNSAACWTSKNGVRWPDLIVTDDRLAHPSVFMSGYYTAIDSGDYKIVDCAREVLQGLQEAGINGEPAPLSKPNIVFVCHSLGGIVVRYMLERYRNFFQPKNIILLLIASPSYGADLASALSGISKFFKNKLAQQLISANESLDDLDDRFKDLVANKLIPRLSGAEAIEHKFPLHWKFMPAIRPLVIKSSASRYFGACKLLKDTDHSTCVKPTDHQHVSHRFLVDVVKGFEQEKQTAAQNPNPIVAVQPASNLNQKCQNTSVLFEVYTLDVSRFYLFRRIDINVNTALNVSSLWVFGPSGIGKTASIRHEVLARKLDSVQIYIGATSGLVGGHVALLQEIYFTIVSRYGEPLKEFAAPKQVMHEIAIVIEKHCKNRDVCLVIDEIPVLENASEEMPKFVQSIHALIVTLRQQFSLSNVRVVLTSLFDPRDYIQQGNERIFEQIMFLSFTPWIEEDIEKLVGLVITHMPELVLSEAEISEVVRVAQGSPRLVKTFFRNYAALLGDSRYAVVDILRETAQSINGNGMNMQNARQA